MAHARVADFHDDCIVSLSYYGRDLEEGVQTMAKNSVMKAPFLTGISRPTSMTWPEGYPFDIPLFKNGFDLSIEKPVLIISGENGTGKSTLIESIAANCGFNLSGGS